MTLISRFHPANDRVKQIVESGELGKLKNIYGSLLVPIQMRLFPLDDMRFDYNLGGGVLMDMGCQYDLLCTPHRICMLTTRKRLRLGDDSSHGVCKPRRNPSYFQKARQMGMFLRRRLISVQKPRLHFQTM